MEDTVWSNWQSLPQPDARVSEPCIVPNAGGGVEVFISIKNAVLRNHQVSAGGAWQGWEPVSKLPGDIDVQSLAVGQNHDGRLELFGVWQGAVWHVWQTAPNKGWSAWKNLGKPDGADLGQVTVARNQDGRLEVIAISVDGRAWHNWQHDPGTDWKGWHSLSNPASVQVSSVVVERDSNGFLQAFTTGPDDMIRNISQQPSPHPWTWSVIGRRPAPPVLSLAVGRNESGLLELFATTFTGGVSHAWQNRDVHNRLSWSTLSGLGKPPAQHLGSIAVSLNQNGLLQAFVVAESDNSYSVWTITQQKGTITGWGEWTSLGALEDDQVIIRLRVTRSGDGRLSLFSSLNVSALGYREELQVSKLQWFENLAASVAPVVYMHPDEPFMPCSFEWYLDRTIYKDANGKGDKGLTSADVQQAKHGEGGYLTYPWNDGSVRAGHLPSAVCYAHIMPRRDAKPGYDVQYWFFSAFNGAGCVGLHGTLAGQDLPELTVAVEPLGEHEGDWEEVIVRVDQNGAIQSVFYSVHDYGKWYRHATKPGAHDGYTLMDGHPVVYSALNGHPSFPWVGDFPTCKDGAPLQFMVGSENFNITGRLLNQTGQGARWDCYLPNHLKLLAVDTPDLTYSSNTWWFPFKGRVGAIKPSIGDQEQEAIENLRKRLWLFLLPGVAQLIAAAIIQGLIVAVPFVEDPRGPEALAAKDDWYKGPAAELSQGSAC